ncbi:MAG: hypothetical protein ACTSVU_00800 [Promethearchaeota archaeon]
MAPDQNQINISEINMKNIEKNKENIDQDPNLKPSAQSNSLDHWLADILKILGQISNLSDVFNTPESISSGKSKPVAFGEAGPFIIQLELLLERILAEMNNAIGQITELSEENLGELIGTLKAFNSFPKFFTGIKQTFLDMMDLLDLDQYSYCPNCLSLEKTQEFVLCEHCHQELIKGNDIRPFLIDNLFSRELPLPMEVIQTLHQRFQGKVREIHFDFAGKPLKRQMVDIPIELKLQPDRSYTFFIIDDTQKITPMVIPSLKSGEGKNRPHREGQSEQSTIEICRNCGTKMQFLRTTMYYETSAELFKCPNCGMEKLTNIKPIWESGIEEK